MPAGDHAVAAQAPQTVGTRYVALSTGPLWQARLVQLPAGLLLRAGEVHITAQQLEAKIAQYARQGGAAQQLRQWRFYVLENMAVEVLLMAEARKWAGAGEDQKPDLLEAYLRSIADAATVDETQVRAFYEANRDAFGAQGYEQVADWLKEYLLDEKRQELVDRHINSLSERHEVEVDADFAAQAAELELANPVAEALRSGLPSIVDFGSHGCRPCDMMTPILEELRSALAGRCNVLFVSVVDEPILAARYGIQSIPVQIFFDASGREVFRHVGYYPKEAMLRRLQDMGVQP